ncbi:MAG TPA: autotransporter domain-containing protein [Polyangiales bacterium]
MLKRFALAASLAFASAAHAQDPPQTARDSHTSLSGFGVPRQWAFSTDAELAFRRTTLSGQNGAVTSLSIAPGVDYFVIQNLSIGGGIGLFYTKAGSQNATTFSIGPRVGYNFELSRLLSIWPKLGLSYSYTNQDSARDNSNGVALNLYAPVMFHPARHFMAGFGPFLDADLSGGTRATSWGVKLTMGGWLNSEPQPNPPRPALPQP